MYKFNVEGDKLSRQMVTSATERLVQLRLSWYTFKCTFEYAGDEKKIDLKKGLF